jgi:hypothetical protein
MLMLLCCATLMPYIAVSGTMREASSAGFRKIANFIFGAYLTSQHLRG